LVASTATAIDTMTDNTKVKEKQFKTKKPLSTQRVSIQTEFKLSINGSYDVFIKKLEEKLDTMSNNKYNEYLILRTLCGIK
jgi:hypothetical protein